MKNKQIQFLYGVSGVQILGFGMIFAVGQAGSVVVAVGTAALVVYATGMLIKAGSEKACPKCKASISKKARICPECGYRYKDGIAEDQLTEYIEQEKEKEMTSEKIDYDFEQIESIAVEKMTAEMTAFDGDIEDFLQNRYKEEEN